jgi:REP element-mobilizing transposase RayT
MPDHVHLVVEGQSPESDLFELIRLWKSKTALAYKREAGKQLWQCGFYDRILRSEDDMVAAAMYVIENPVRAKLVVEPHHYPFLGSDTTTVDEILKRGAEIRRWRSAYVRQPSV